MSCKNALEIKNLTVVQESTGRAIVGGVSFGVPAGGAVALAGESGCGKTMTSMAVMGLLPAGIRKAGGDVFIGGRDASALSAEQYRQLRHSVVSIVMQNPMSAFNPVMNIFAHFAETLASHEITNRREIRRRAEAALAEAGFADPGAALALYPFQMSGGMLQRVMLAIALTSSPDLIIADEATTDLDVLSQARVLEILKGHCVRRHCALLLITHDLSVAATMADRIVLMKEGRVVEENTVEEFFAAPRTRYAQRMLELHRALYTPGFLKIMDRLAGGGSL